MGPPTKINSPWQRQIASFIREYTIRARECISRLSRSIDQRARAGRDLVATETPTSGTAIVHQDTRMFRFLWSSGYIRRRCACPLVCLSVQPFVRPSIRPFVCLSVCLSVRPYVRPFVHSFVRPLSAPAHFGRVHRRLAPARRVFDRLSLGLYGLWGSFKPPRRFSAPCPSALFPPPSTPNVPSRPRRRRRWRRHGVHGDRREENRRDEERCERTTRTAGHRRPG